MPDNRSLKIVVAQIGRREHYAIPLALERAGMLSHFFTDGYCGPGSWCHPLAKMLPPFLNRGVIAWALGRSSTIPKEKVTAFNLLGARYTYKLLRAKSFREANQTYLWCAKKFTQNILKYRKDLLKAQAIYGLNSVSQELFSFGSAHGLKLIVNQIDPSLYEERLLAEEYSLWPDWEKEPALAQEDELFAREQVEWDLADTIIVNSEFSKNALVSLGAKSEKIQIVPLAIDIRRFRPGDLPRNPGRLNFLFLGTVGLRKGIQYALEAFRLVKSANITFTVVGRTDPKFQQCKLQEYSDVCNYIGPIPGEIVDTYQRGDVFIFPTISEGFGLTQLEALACGLPVITTPNCGAVVRDGVDGFIVPIRDAVALAEKIDLLASNPGLLIWMRENARQRALEFSWEEYERNLVGAVSQSFGTYQNVAE